MDSLGGVVFHARGEPWLNEEGEMTLFAFAGPLGVGDLLRPRWARSDRMDTGKP